MGVNMANAYTMAFYKGKPVGPHTSMQAALTAAEALGYTLAPSERVLPELPEGWRISKLINGGTATETPWWSCTLHSLNNVYRRPTALGPTPRAAVEAAIGKVQK